MNKSLLIKQLANTKFSELPEETLEELYHIINRKDEPKEVCPKCYYSKLAYYSSLQYKQCTKCGFKIAWKLNEKQKPLVKHQR